MWKCWRVEAISAVIVLFQLCNVNASKLLNVASVNVTLEGLEWSTTGQDHGCINKKTGMECRLHLKTCVDACSTSGKCPKWSKQKSGCPICKKTCKHTKDVSMAPITLHEHVDFAFDKERSVVKLLKAGIQNSALAGTSEHSVAFNAFEANDDMRLEIEVMNDLLLYDDRAADYPPKAAADYPPTSAEYSTTFVDSNGAFAVQAQYATRMTFQNIKAGLTATFQAVCKKDFYGCYCEKQCQAKNRGETCDEDGLAVCKPNYYPSKDQVYQCRPDQMTRPARKQSPQGQCTTYCAKENCGTNCHGCDPDCGTPICNPGYAAKAMGDRNCVKETCDFEFTGYTKNHIAYLSPKEFCKLVNATCIDQDAYNLDVQGYFHCKCVAGDTDRRCQIDLSTPGITSEVTTAPVPVKPLNPEEGGTSAAMVVMLILLLLLLLLVSVALIGTCYYLYKKGDPRAVGAVDRVRRSIRKSDGAHEIGEPAPASEQGDTVSISNPNFEEVN